MRRALRITSLTFIAMVLVTSGTSVQARSDNWLECERAPSERWGLLSDFTGSYFAQRDSRITQYVRYCWIPQSDTIEVEGRDNSGRIIAGQISLIEPAKAARGTIVRTGSDFVFVVTMDLDTAIFIGSEGGAAVRQSFNRVGPFEYAMVFAERRGQQWATLRQFSYEKITWRMVEALGFPQPTPEDLRQSEAERQAALARTSSFGKRFAAAMQDALITGAATGTAAGLSRRVEDAIAPRPSVR